MNTSLRHNLAELLVWVNYWATNIEYYTNLLGLEEKKYLLRNFPKPTTKPFDVHFPLKILR